MFQPITINKFQGLNSAIVPELIEVGEARDIYNFRHEKLGKLVSRNGYVYGLFTKADDVTWLQEAQDEYDNATGDNSRYHDAEQAYIFNKGFIGIGEYILDGQIDFLDTDRFMVYVCRAKVDGETYDPNKYSQCYLIAPLTGKYKDFLFNAGVTETDQYRWDDGDKNPTYLYERDQTAQGVIDEGRDKLTAPTLPFLDYEYGNILATGAFRSTEWIDSFVKINQYRHQLVISDRTNGDTLIEDEYSLRTGQECDPVEHSLRIRPNSLDSFDIDVVNFDLRLDTNQENALDGDGVETAMALYQFEVEKDVFKVTQDYRDDEVTKIDYFESIPYEDETITLNSPFPDKDVANAGAAQTVLTYMDAIDNLWENGVKPISRVPLHIRQYIPTYTENQQLTSDNDTILWSGRDYSSEYSPFLKYDYNEDLRYLYTNVDSPDEFTNIADNVRLQKTETVDQEGMPIDSYSSGVYLWQDFKLQYKPVKSKDGLYYVQTAEDKEYDRTIAGQPRIVEFETPEGFARQVPLTGWQYKFVWDYGNGVLSAPSVEIKAPDLLWRVSLDDANITDSQRLQLSVSEWEKTLGKFQADPQLGELSTMPPVFEADGSLTGFGLLLWRLKNKLYSESHLFGSQTQVDDIADIESMTDLQKENIGTLLTVVSKEVVSTKGIFCEGLTVLAPSLSRTNASGIQYRIHKDWSRTPFYYQAEKHQKFHAGLDIGTYLTAAPYIIYARLPLKVPMRPTVDSATFNSVFDIFGKLRTGYLNTSTRTLNYAESNTTTSLTAPGTDTDTYDFQSNVISKQLILPGYNGGISALFSAHTENDRFHYRRYYDFVLPSLGDVRDLYARFGHNTAKYQIMGGTEVFNRYITLFYDRTVASPTEVGFVEGTQIMLSTIISSPFISQINDIATSMIDGVTLSPILQAATMRHITSDGTSVGVYEYGFRDTHQSFATYTFSEAILGNYSPRSASNGIFLNIVANDLDENNTNNLTTSRASTLLRHVTNEQDRLLRLNNSVPSQVAKRILLQGYADLKLTDYDEELFWDTQYFVDNLAIWDDAAEYTRSRKPIDNLARDYERVPMRLNNSPTPVNIRVIPNEDSQLLPPTTTTLMNSSSTYDEHREFTTNNIETHIYLEGERLLAYEQLTSVFPSSLLFNAPRLGVTINENKIPRRAKRLRIYRTISTGDNAFDPNSYGLVEEVDIFTATERIEYQTGLFIEIGEKYTVDEDGNKYPGVYYFDEVKDANLDFNFDINESEGLRKPIRSRFNMPLNERMYYANFKQHYRPESPRLHQEKATINEDVDGVSSEKAYNTHYHIFGYSITLPTNEDATKYYDRTDKEYVRYAYAYEDVNGIISEIKYTGVIDPTMDASSGTFAAYNFGQVVLFHLPNSYNGSIKHLNVYRTKYVLPTSRTGIEADYLAAEAVMTADTYAGKYYKIAEIDEKSMGILYDTYLPDKEEMGCDHEVVEDYESGVMFSEAYRPDFIKAESLLEYRSGDGDQITGLASLYGNLIVAKENSLHRIAVQMEDATVSRVDEITPDVGCIAPETFMTVDNNLYFVSNQGIMMYENNTLVPIDEKINEEIRTYLRMLKEYPDPIVGNLTHYITAGYNPEFRELYFNFPQLVYPVPPGSPPTQFDDAVDYKMNFYQYARQFEAHIYVYNLDKKYWTKFAYTQTLEDSQWNRTVELDPETEYNPHYIKQVEHALANSRLYFTNSLGELRSADIMTSNYAVGPNIYEDPLDDELKIGEDWEGHEWAGTYIETPTNPPKPGRTVSGNVGFGIVEAYFSTDDALEGVRLGRGLGYEIRNPEVPPFWDTELTFPPRRGVPITVKYKSHFITLDSETIMKRVNRIVGNVYSEDEFTVKLLVQNKTSSDERISNNYPTHTFTYNPTQVTSESNPHPLTGINRSAAVIDNNIITAIPMPTVVEDAENDDYALDDTNLKGVRFSIEFESSMRTQLNEFVLFVRPIHVLNNYTRVGN